MSNFLKLSFIIISSSYIIGCASPSPMNGNVKDELYHIDNNPLTITDNNVQKLEAQILQSDGFDTSVSDLSVSDRQTVSDNLLVLFHFDSDAINDDMVVILDKQLDILSSNPNLRVMLEGRTDERGTRAYNLVLGDHRSEIVKDYLIKRGVSSEQILTVSLGENEPLFLEVEKEKNKFWKLNRSVFFKFID